MKTTIFFIASLLVLSINALNAQCGQRNTAFRTGEEVNYEFYYNLSFIWVHAGNARFTVRPAYYKQNPAYQFKVTGTTLKSFDKFFRVRDTLETFVDTVGITPYAFREASHEDDYWKINKFEYRQEPAQWRAFLNKEKKSGVENDTVSSGKCFFDILSTIYRIRNLDTNSLQSNQRIGFNLLLDDGIYSLYLKFVGRETVKLKSGERYRCLVFKPQLVEGEVFKNAEGMTIWVTDDENRIPVYIESKIRVGSIKVQMSGIKNVRYPISSKL